MKGMRLVAGAVSAALVACGADAGTTFTDEEWAAIRTLSPLPEVATCPTGYEGPGADDGCDDLAALGQMIFFDPSMSGPLAIGDDGTNGTLGAVGETGKVSCATCHDPDAWFADPGQATSRGASFTTRNTPSLVNAAFYSAFTWDGEYDDLATVIAAPLSSPRLMASSPLRLGQVVYAKYREEHEALFGPLDARFDESSAEPPPDDVLANLLRDVGLAVEAYERRLISRDAPFDRFVAGDESAISEKARLGLALFIGKALCIECHHGPTFSDGAFYATGVPQVGENVPAEDLGRGSIPGYEDQAGAFRTPHLRQIAETAPYMHTGGLVTLDDVVRFYNWGGPGGLLPPLGLSDAEIDAIVAFLETLTGGPLPADLLVDTSR